MRMWVVDVPPSLGPCNYLNHTQICRAGYRSEAVYIRSEDAAVSNGVGYVQTLAIAATFSILPLSRKPAHGMTPRRSLLTVMHARQAC